MGQKTNPISLRLQPTNRYFDSSWYNHLFYSDLLSQDFKIQHYINSILKQIRYPLGRFYIRSSHKKIQIVTFFCSPHKLRRLKSNYFRLKYYKHTRNKKQASIIQKMMMSEKTTISSFRYKQNNDYVTSINTLQKIYGKNGRFFQKGVLFQSYLRFILYQNFLQRYYASTSAKEKDFFFNRKRPFHLVVSKNFLQKRHILSPVRGKSYKYIPLIKKKSIKEFSVSEKPIGVLFSKKLKKKISPTPAFHPLANSFPLSLVREKSSFSLRSSVQYVKKSIGKKGSEDTSTREREAPLFHLLSKHNKDPISSILFFRKIYHSSLFLTNFFLQKNERKKTTQRRYLLEQFYRIHRSYRKFLPVLKIYPPTLKVYGKKQKKQPKFNTVLAKQKKSYNSQKDFLRTSKNKNSFLQKLFTYSNSIKNTDQIPLEVNTSTLVSFSKLINWQKNYLLYNQKKQTATSSSIHFPSSLHNVKGSKGKKVSEEKMVSEGNQGREYLTDSVVINHLSSSNSTSFLNSHSIKTKTEQPDYLALQRAGGVMRYQDNIEATLCKSFSSNVYNQFLKVKDPFRSAIFLADEIVYLLQRRIAFRFIKNWILRDIEPLLQKKAIHGIRITCSGRVGGRSKKAQRAKSETIKRGQTSLHVFSSHIDFASKSAFTSFGVIGIKVWISYGQSNKKQLSLQNKHYR